VIRRGNLEPFLLPTCGCGGLINLSMIEPHPIEPEHEVRTFRCADCGAEHRFVNERPAKPTPAELGGI
jgi:hypothetical protein